MAWSLVSPSGLGLRSVVGVCGGCAPPLRVCALRGAGGRGPVPPGEGAGEEGRRNCVRIEEGRGVAGYQTGYRPR